MGLHVTEYDSPPLALSVTHSLYYIYVFLTYVLLSFPPPPLFHTRYILLITYDAGTFFFCIFFLFFHLFVKLTFFFFFLFNLSYVLTLYKDA